MKQLLFCKFISSPGIAGNKVARHEGDIMVMRMMGTPISAGMMSVSAEFKAGKRRIIEFFIYPLIKFLHLKKWVADLKS